MTVQCTLDSMLDGNDLYLILEWRSRSSNIHQTSSTSRRYVTEQKMASLMLMNVPCLLSLCTRLMTMHAQPPSSNLVKTPSAYQTYLCLVPLLNGTDSPDLAPMMVPAQETVIVKNQSLLLLVDQSHTINQLTRSSHRISVSAVHAPDRNI